MAKLPGPFILFAAKYVTGFFIAFFGLLSTVSSQQFPDSISRPAMEKIITFLASDSLKGRGNGRPELLKAGLYIGQQFQQAGLKKFPATAGFYLPFIYPGTNKKKPAHKLLWNGKEIPADRFVYLRSTPGPYPLQSLTDFNIQRLDSFSASTLPAYPENEAAVLLWTSDPDPDDHILRTIADHYRLNAGQNVLMVYADEPPVSILLNANASYYSNLGYNVVGVLPGRSKPEELVIFSAHYDHEGVYSRKKKDSIMNGANDNASGTTALLSLAAYFAGKADNERTLVFCAFAGEELGLLGSKDFVRSVDPDKVVAVINLEMLSFPQFGNGTVFITGYGNSNMPAMLEKGLVAAGCKVIEDRVPEHFLFGRSDNFPFARKGIPAHSIMSSNDNQACYHKPCDDLSAVDIAHLHKITRGIALAAQPIIDGTFTPRRIGVSEYDDQ